MTPNPNKDAPTPSSDMDSPVDCEVRGSVCNRLAWVGAGCVLVGEGCIEGEASFGSDLCDSVNPSVFMFASVRSVDDFPFPFPLPLEAVMSGLLSVWM